MNATLKWLPALLMFSPLAGCTGNSSPVEPRVVEAVVPADDEPSSGNDVRFVETNPACVLRLQRKVTDRRLPPRAGVTESPEMATLPDNVLKQQAAVLELGMQYFDWTVDQQTECFVPAAHKIYSRRDRDSNWLVYSLVANVSFRVNELQNRQGIAGVVQAANGPSESLFNIETALGIQMPVDQRGAIPPTKIESISRGDTITYRRESTEWATLETSDHRIPAQCERSWRLFLRHCCHLHPAIREQILQQPCFPRKLTYREQSATRELETVLALQGVSEQEPRKAAPAANGYYTLDSPAELTVCLNSVKAHVPVNHSEVYHRAESAVRDAMAANNGLDGMLSAFEYLYIVGDDLRTRQLFQILRPVVKDDPLARIYFDHLQPGSPDASRAATAFFESLDRTHLRRAYMIDVAIASSKGMTENAADQEMMYLRILSAHPELAGAWIELGKHYSQTFRHMDAWHCFDAARQISPRHEMLQEIDQLESALFRDFPSYF